MSRRRWFVVLVAGALVAAGCSTVEDTLLGADEVVDTTAPDTTTTTEAPPEPASPGQVAAIEATIGDQAVGCELLDGASCLLPYPSDGFTVDAEAVARDDDLGPGNPLRLAFDPSQVPANAAGVPIDPTEWNRLDGFSPGTAMLTVVPGLDAEASGLPPVTDVAASLEDDSPVVLFDADSGIRVPVWAELDANVTDPDQQPLIIRPAVNLNEGHRHVVGIRNLRDADGETIAAPPAFEVIRDQVVTEVDEVEALRPRIDEVITDLARQDVERDELYLAWDFTVASRRGMAERMLHLRDDGFAQLDGAAPSFEVTEVVDSPGNPPGDHVARWVEGTFEVPLYLTDDGGPGTGFSYGDDGLPVRRGTYTATFSCSIPESVVADRIAGRPVVYGHGLLGSQDELRADHISVAGNANDFVYCATDWIGMSEQDVPNVLAILTDLSSFSTLADRVQQGVLNTLFLARLMVHEDGFVSDPAFQAPGTGPLLDTTEAYFDGNSQGAIIGGMATAFAQDWTKAVLGVGGMNYSTLLRRSVEFDTYALALKPSYPDELDQTIAISLIQLLWDRAETNGYAAHVTDDPYPNTPEHTVLMQVAVGDYQVSTVAAEVMARTIGASVMPEPLAPDRTADEEPAGLIPRIDVFPHEESALVYWDSGTPIAPTENLPPSPDGVPDPHEDPRRQTAAIAQKNTFLRPDGVVEDVCAGTPCQAIPRDELTLEP